ncbi:hypothetical protein EDB85DRAFT_2159886 [Lactarius pseudohatsudake]|nr:hypothetical protein EDB85DRAFT_2159886 [Lactarius pseudohatsudake]
MAFRSVGSHQRTILFLSTALALSFSFIQPSVTVERRRLPNVGKASLINTPELVRKVRSVAYRPAGRMKESRYAQLERVLRIVDSPGVTFDNDEGMLGQNPEGVDDLTSDDIRSMLFLQSRLHSNASPLRVVDILPQTQAQDSKDAHNLPTFNTTLEFTNMLALSTDHHLKVGLLPVLLFFPRVCLRWRELGVACPRAEEAVLTLLESCKHRSCSGNGIINAYLWSRERAN